LDQHPVVLNDLEFCDYQGLATVYHENVKTTSSRLLLVIHECQTFFDPQTVASNEFFKLLLETSTFV
jgi:hypothetical protein